MDKRAGKKYLNLSMKACRELDVVSAFDNALKAVESDPGEVKAWYSIKNLVETVWSGYPETYDGKRLEKALERGRKAIPQEPIIPFLSGVINKIDENYLEAESFLLAALHRNRRAGDLFNQPAFLFNYAYVLKNQGRLEPFTSIALSALWNVPLYRGYRQFALPGEALEKYLFNPDFNQPPIRDVKKIKSRGGGIRFLVINDFPAPGVLAKYLTALSKQGIDAVLYHMLPRNYSLPAFSDERGAVPSSPFECPAAAFTSGYTLNVCKALADRINPLLKRIEPPWDVVVENRSFCRCREEESDV